MITKHMLAAGFCAIGFALSATPAMAGPHADAPGTPGEANCVGQTTAFAAQASKDLLGEPGLGNLADFSELSVKEVRAVVQAFCAGEAV